MGTAGSLKLMKRKVKKPIIIINGDILTELKFRDLIQFHKENKSMQPWLLKWSLMRCNLVLLKIFKVKIIRGKAY